MTDTCYVDPVEIPPRPNQNGNSLLYLTVLVMCALVLGIGCPKLPPPSGCTPGTYDCYHNQPRVCSPDQRDTPIGDQPCSAIGAACVVDGGMSYCARAQ